MVTGSDAMGWYVDPFGLHDERYFSQGRATSLVRDGDVESVDPPPGEGPVERLVRADSHGKARDHGSDMLRADDAERREPVDPDITFDLLVGVSAH